MKALVLAEDPILDQYMLKPLVEAALVYAGWANPIVRVCQDRNQRGDASIIDSDAIVELMEIWSLFDCYILCVDRDCRESRRRQLDDLEISVSSRKPQKRFVAVCGIQELEVWVLAGMKDLPQPRARDLLQPWADVRQECHPKESYFEPFVRIMLWQDTPGRGRQRAGEAAAKQYEARVRTMCPEIQRCEIARLSASRPGP